MHSKIKKMVCFAIDIAAYVIAIIAILLFFTKDMIVVKQAELIEAQEEYIETLEIGIDEEQLRTEFYKLKLDSLMYENE